MPAVVVERPHPQPLRPQQVEVDVGHRALLLGREPLGLGQQPAVLVDHRLAVPGQIGGRLPLARRGVDVGRQAARRGRACQQLAVFGPPDGDRAARQVGQHGRPGQRRLRAGRHRYEHVLADLDVQHESGHVGRAEQQIGAEGHLGPGDADCAANVVPRRDLAPFVELAVGRQVRLRGHPQNGTAVDHHRGVVDPVQVAQRRPHHEHG